jgi:hypothetical protein
VRGLMNALVIAAGDAAMPNPPTSEQVAKLAAELEAAKRARREAEALLGEAALQKLRTQQKVDALLRETSPNVDRTKVANDGSREEEG